jgi:tRNA threonylcarbamoyladenosine biosynthesis protein TsaB
VDLDRLAVTVGPGSFTGLRVGVAAARGIALAASKTVIGLTTLAAFAAPHVADDDTTPLLAAIDARNQEVYMQLFGRGGRTLIQPRLATLREVVRMVAGRPARLVGSAARIVEGAWPATERPPLLVAATSAPDIDWVARLGAAAVDVQAAPKPLYLRAPGAQPQEARLPRR